MLLFLILLDYKGFVSASNGLSLSSVENDGEIQWSSFIKTCVSVQSANILNKLDEFKSSNCLFIVIRNDEQVLSKSKIPTSHTIETNLLTNTNAEIIHLNLGRRSDVSLPSRVKSVEFGSRLQTIADLCRDSASSYLSQCLEEFALKLILNAVSTGAHVLIGKTYENIMVDVRVSNVKLFYRALGILKRLSNEKEMAKCEECLLRAIYGMDDLGRVEKAHIEEHIKSATVKGLVVPKALIMLLTKCSYDKADEYLKKSHNSVRNCIFKLKKTY